MRAATRKPAQTRVVLTGFCNRSNPEESHARCPVVLPGDIMCRCGCHPHRVVVYPEGKGYVTECRCGWLKWDKSKALVEADGAAHVRDKEKAP